MIVYNVPLGGDLGGVGLGSGEEAVLLGELDPAGTTYFDEQGNMLTDKYVDPRILVRVSVDYSRAGPECAPAGYDFSDICSNVIPLVAVSPMMTISTDNCPVAFLVHMFRTSERFVRPAPCTLLPS